MKKILLSSIIILTSIFSFAQDKNYREAMGTNLEELAQAKSSTDFQAVANSFEIIADASPDKWLPNYYTAFCYINMVFAQGSEADIDKTLDKAEAFLGKARKISPDNSEIEVLQGWVYQGRIQVDPMGRGMSYSEKASGSFGQAKNLNPNNPRTYYLTGQNVLHTPEMFGGGEENACPYFLKAKEKYDTFKPETPFSPNWGKEHNEKLAAKCN